MIKKLITFSIISTAVFAQLSLSDVNKLSNQQLDLIKNELQSKSALSSTKQARLDSGILNPAPIIFEGNLGSDITIIDEYYFGYEYFKKDINFFDNIPTPPQYKLGPGDEIVLSLWGENNSREVFTLTKDGMIYYENIGFISLANKTLKEAEDVLKKALSKVYSTLNDNINPTYLMLQLGQLKSINVFFSGNVPNPGVNLIHPFSDIYTAIVQMGGIKNLGSLRNVELIRDGKKVFIADFYSFFLNGSGNFLNERILEGDIIHVPNYHKRVKIDGEVRKPGYYELLDGENASLLIEFAADFTSNAATQLKYNSIIPVEKRQSDDIAKESNLIQSTELSKLFLNDGDSLTALSIKYVSNQVEVLGRVKFPGNYPSSSNLKEVLDAAGGFEDPVFRNSIMEEKILILRLSKNSFYNEEITISYDDSNNFELQTSDKILVYEDTNFTNSFSIQVNGEIKVKGLVPFRAGMTLRDAINLAGGLTELGDENSILVFDTLDNINTNVSSAIGNITMDSILSPNSSVRVPQKKFLVSVEGNVFRPGLVQYSSKPSSLKAYIELAGGLKPNTAKKRIYLKRSNGKIEKVGLLRGAFLSIKPGDTIFVPLDTRTRPFDPTMFTADILSILANLVAIVAILDNTNN